MVTVLDSKDLVTSLTTGETPVPKEVAEDNARQKAAATQNSKPQAKEPEKASSKAAESTTDANDDVEGEDGLTPRQKREFTEAMIKSIGKKHREKLEAEEFAADQYNQRVLAEKRAEAAERERESFKEQLAKLQPAKVEESAEPKRENFATEQDYQDARVDWRADQKLKAREAESAQQRQRAIAENCQASLQRAVELVPDFQEVTSAAELNIPGHIVHLMQESGLFAEFGYHFAKNPDDLAKLVISTPNKIKLEFQKIEGKLTPFASRTAAGADGKANGQKPSASETESASPTTAASGTGVDPSKPRGTAPVITPLSAGSSAQVEKPAAERNIREEITLWQKKSGRNLALRKRH